MTEEGRQRALGERILQRAERPEDLVPMVVFLASDESEFVTAQTLHVDGGSVIT
jgi:NAD(P)-dependent dehydrogenase (short-subunit alcohol dehydrogenase family)